MTLVEALTPVRVTLRARGVTVVLRPGQPTPFDDDEARRLLERLGGKVRTIPAPEATTKAPGPCPACGGGPLRPFETAPPGFVAEPAPNRRPVYWEDARGAIREGRAVLLGRDGTTFWVGIETTDGFQWVRDDRLRSRADFETQRPLRAVEPIREARAHE